jgi:D-aspartate ligase
LAANGRGASFVPAVIIGAEVNGLGVVRSLAKGGVRTIVVGKSLRHAAIWSRWSKSRVIDRLFGRSLIDYLLKLQKGIGVRPFLILTDEMSVNTVSEHRDELSPHYRFRLPPPAMVTTLGNKASFQHLAESNSLPVPKTIIVERESDLAGIPALGMPIIVKPADKLQVHFGAIERATLVPTMEEAAATCRQLLKTAGSLVVQEWIDGPDSNIYFSLFHCSRSPPSRNIFFGRKVAAHPPALGMTAVCMPAPEAANLLRPLTERFLDVSEYEGLGGLEFKWDPRTQRFVIIEPTVGRTDWQEEIATLNGLNLVLAAYRHEVGLPALEGPPLDAVAWRESFRHYRRSSGLGVRSYDGYWRIDDPLPALAFSVDLAFRSVPWLRRQLVTKQRKPQFHQRRTA